MVLEVYYAQKELAIILGIFKGATFMHQQKHVMNANLVTILFILDYEKDGDVCSYSPPSDYSGCCSKYNPSGTCEECASGLALINGKCEDIQVPGCI